jgi:uncharacterized membrane protein YqaE (UPF0057 family)
MKKINYNFLLSSLMAIFLFASCSSTKYGAHFQPSSHPSYAHEKQDDKQEPVLQAQEEEASSVITEEMATRSGAEEVKTDALPAIGSLKDLMALDMPAKEELSLHQREVIATTKERLKNMTRKEKRALRKEIRNLKLSDYSKNLPAYARDMGEMQAEGAVSTLVLVILAIILPPLAVFLHQGEINNKFWISLLLTVLGYVPGQVYSLLVVLGVI